jgi:hypothetical protein
MADQRKYLQTQVKNLAGAGVSLGATSMILVSFKQIDGTTNIVIGDFGTKGWGTLEPGTPREEQISFTGVTQNADGSATITGIKSVAFNYPYTESSGFAKSHAGGAKFVISNNPGLYDSFANKENDETISQKWTFNTVPDSTQDPSSGNNLVRKSYIDGIRDKVKSTTNDTTPNFLFNKISSGTNITKVLLNAGGDELVQINASAISTSAIVQTYLAEEDLTAGVPVGISNLVSDSVAKAVTTVYTNTSTGFDGNISQKAQIDTNKFVMAYIETATDDLYVVAATVDRSDMKNVFAWGAPVLVISNLASSNDPKMFFLHKLDTDKFAVTYTENANPDEIQIVGATVAGTAITLGTPVTAAAAGGGNDMAGHRSAQLGTDKGVIAWNDNAAANQGAVVYTFAGTVPTIGTPVSLNANLYNGGGIGVGKVATDKFAVSGNKYIQVATVSGTTITLGTAVNFSAGTLNTAIHDIVANPADNVIVISYSNANGSNVSNLIAATISGTTPTFGSAITSAATTGRSIYKVSSSQMYLWDNNSNSLKLIALSGTTISPLSTLIRRIDVSSSAIGLETYLIDGGGYFILSATSSTGSGTEDHFIQGMSNNFVGITQNTVNRGDPVTVLIHGVDINQADLIPGAYYQASEGAFIFAQTGATTDNPNEVRLALAVNSTTIEI